MRDTQVSNLFAAFLQFLYDRGDILTVDDAIYVVEKPWKWTAEFSEFEDARAVEQEMSRV